MGRLMANQDFRNWIGNAFAVFILVLLFIMIVAFLGGVIVLVVNQFSGF